MESVSNLPQVNRYVTTHDAEGKVVYSTALATELIRELLPGNIQDALGYSTKGFPIDLNGDADITAYEPFLKSKPLLAIPDGTVLRYVDFPPESLGVMHRTVSIDFGIVVEGEMVCVLDSGEERHLKRGDVLVQRGTMHAWKNPLQEWSRMVYVMTASVPLKAKGEELEQAFGEKLEK